MAGLNDALSQLTLREHLPTGYVYDERMCGHKAEYKHPEQPARIRRIDEQLRTAGLVARMTPLPVRAATDAELRMVHGTDHVAKMASMAGMTLRQLTRLADDYNSIFFNDKSLESALLSAGGTVALVEAIATGRVRNGIANVRPPGHHAEHDEAMGFCTYNNVAVAAALARAHWGVKRIAIIDWDVHWGNGTYHTFAEDPSILYISTHRYDLGRFYPADKDAAPEVVGTGAGAGFSVHVGWDGAGVGDGGYLAAFETVIMPICREFDPDLVIVSAGFDAARGDPLGGCDITPAGYAHMTHKLMSLAGGRVAVVLEGGYSLASISHSMAACASVLLGDLPPDMARVQPEPNAALAIMKTVAAHQPYWKCLKDVTTPVLFAGYKRPETAKTPHASPVKQQDGAGAMLSSPAKTLLPKTATGGPVSSSGDSSSSSSSGGGSSSSSSGGPSSSSGGGSSSSSSGAAGGGAAGDDVAGFAVEPLAWCPHLESIAPVERAPEVNVHAPCELCGDLSENWVCLHCTMVGCSRFVREHMVMHNEGNPTHAMALSFSDLSVWCYGCEAYVHHEALLPFKKAAYRQKFDEDAS